MSGLSILAYRSLLKAAELLKYVWPFCEHQALKGLEELRK